MDAPSTVRAALTRCERSRRSRPLSSRTQSRRRRPLFIAHEDRSALEAVGWADHAVYFHLLDQTSGAVVANPQSPLQHGRGSRATLAHDFECLFHERIVLTPGIVGQPAAWQFQPF